MKIYQVMRNETYEEPTVLETYSTLEAAEAHEALMKEAELLMGSESRHSYISVEDTEVEDRTPFIYYGYEIDWSGHRGDKYVYVGARLEEDWNSTQKREGRIVPWIHSYALTPGEAKLKAEALFEVALEKLEKIRGSYESSYPEGLEGYTNYSDISMEFARVFICEDKPTLVVDNRRGIVVGEFHADRRGQSQAKYFADRYYEEKSQENH